VRVCGGRLGFTGWVVVFISVMMCVLF